VLTRLLFALLLGVLALPATAQLQVELTFPRRLYVAFEPVIATVSIANFSGRELQLRDDGSTQWFGFQIQTTDDRIIAPRDPNYRLDPLTLAPGERVKRTVNLVQLFGVTEFAQYRVRAAIHDASSNRFFYSQPKIFEVTEGRMIWEQTLGIPEGEPATGKQRKFTLMTFRQPKRNMLYVRVTDPDEGMVYTTAPIGKLIFDNNPQYEVDGRNNLHVLQLVGPKTFLYSHIDLNGEFVERKTFVETKSRPRLGRAETGTVAVLGGREDAGATASNPAGTAAPKLSERPSDLPKE
jgi:hypothetical protein